MESVYGDAGVLHDAGCDIGRVFQGRPQLQGKHWNLDLESQQCVLPLWMGKFLVEKVLQD
jgi:hypothetical protein